MKSGTLANGLFDISVREINDNFAFVFNGKIECPKDGKYSFTVSSDDGSQLFINGEKIVDNDGVHGNQAKAGSVELKKGKHDIQVKYFELAGGEVLLGIMVRSWALKINLFPKLHLSLGKWSRVCWSKHLRVKQPSTGILLMERDHVSNRCGISEESIFADATHAIGDDLHGEFIDGPRHWIGRGQGFQPPAGSDVIRLPEGVVISELDNSDSVWPGSKYRSKEFDFEGYTFDKFQSHF